MTKKIYKIDGWDESNQEDFLKRLLDITKECRSNMHEPDEQNVSAFVMGDHFDNAGTSSELNLVILNGNRREVFNLASLVALARLAELTQ